MKIVDCLRRGCAAATVVALSFVPPASAAESARHPWTIPNTLRMAISIPPNSLNPILATTTLETDVAKFAFDGLLQFDNAGGLEPKLATVVPSFENGGVSRDGKTITYHLRHGVRWHDGAPFTSRDVAFTWRAIMNPNNNVNTRLGYDQIASVATPDPFTVVIHMKRVFAPALTAIFGYPTILPAHLLEKLSDLNRAEYNAQPIGTGPFKIVRWVRGDRVEYVANDDYFLGKPKLRRIVVRFIPSDNTLAAQIRAHEIDWADRAQSLTFRDLKDAPGVRGLALLQNSYRSLIMNTAHAPLDDIRMRRAIALAIDKPTLVERVAAGTADVAGGDLPPLSWAFDPAVKPIPFDFEGAKRALDELGWKPEADGIRVRDGKRLTLTITFGTGGRETEAVVIQIQDMLHRVGIDAQVHGYDAALLFAPVTGILSTGKFDLNVSSFIGRPDPDDSRQITCANRAPKGFNYSQYCNPEMESAQRDSLSTLDPAKRKAAVSRIQHLLVRDIPQLYIWWNRELHLVNVDLQGLESRPGIPSNFSNRWSI